MNNLQIFNSAEFGEIRTVTIDGEPWFVAKDICEALKHTNPTVAMQMLEEDERTKVSLGRAGETNVINESGLYALIIKSNLPSAKKFRKWVTSEVLPEIRKNGSYQKQLSPQEIMRIQLGMIDDHEGRITTLENTMTIDYGQQKTLEGIVNNTVIECLGGKDSNAYREIGKKVFAECNRDLKNYFNVNARNNVPRKRYEEAFEYARTWRPCHNTMMLINNCNAQMNIE